MINVCYYMDARNVNSHMYSVYVATFCITTFQLLWVSSTSQQTRHILPMFDKCWPVVYDVGPTLVKHWVDVSCFLAESFIYCKHYCQIKPCILSMHQIVSGQSICLHTL